ncbi:MAG: outer membrane lipoprotein-sorting protein [Desulfomonile sp.]|nr:outer membrane lipoprotein-sorting protein [Desulfomonile sp.]
MIRRPFTRACASAGVLLILPAIVWAITAPEIIDQAIKKHVGETFRAVLKIETFQGPKKVSAHEVWIVGQVEEDNSVIFLEISEPEDAKGMRFLFRAKHKEKPEAYMFLPATGQTVPVDVDDPSTDVAGTGLTVGDMQPLFPKPGEKETLEKEEDEVLGKKCWVVKISASGGKEDRFLWIRKDEMDVVRFHQLGPDGKIAREMKVIEFFDTERGRSYPRQEEISVPGKNIHIKVRQEHGVFGIVVPEELMDPKTFGTYKWRM